MEGGGEKKRLPEVMGYYPQVVWASVGRKTGAQPSGA